MSDSTRNRLAAVAMFAVWLTAVLFATWNHAVWRDEVRALSKALDGQNLTAMIHGLRTEGHPAIWYLLLRGAHAIVPRPQVLQLIALPVAAAAALLLVFYSPFPWWLKALLLASNFFLFEYSVLARNYGITLLVLILLAFCYQKYRDRGIVMGILLFLLANCNAPSILLVGGFLLFWLVDLTAIKPPERSRALRNYGWNAALAVAGVVLCLTIITPAPRAPQKSASTTPAPVSRGYTGNAWNFSSVSEAIFLPGISFPHLLDTSQEPGAYVAASRFSAFQVLLSVLLFGSTLGLLRYPGVLLAALGTLIGFSLFFELIYPGFYRQEALWLGFLIVCYWIAMAKGDPPESWKPRRFQAILRPAATVGWGLFLLLMAVQAQIGITHMIGALGDGTPFSSSRDLARWIDGRPDLHDAILMADPEFLLESLPYYLTNPTYYLRDQGFEKFTRIGRALPRVTLEDFLTTGRTLHAETGKPVLILLTHPMDLLLPERIYQEPHHWEFATTPEQVREFTSATQLVESFPAAVTDEFYDVYLLK